MKRQSAEFPKPVRVREFPGITANIYRQQRAKTNEAGKLHRYTSYLLAYSLLGKRKAELET